MEIHSWCCAWLCKFTPTWCWPRVFTRLQRVLVITGLVQERCNSSALAMELRLSCANPSIYKSGDKGCQLCHDNTYPGTKITGLWGDFLTKSHPGKGFQLGLRCFIKGRTLEQQYDILCKSNIIIEIAKRQEFSTIFDIHGSFTHLLIMIYFISKIFGM